MKIEFGKDGKARRAMKNGILIGLLGAIFGSSASSATESQLGVAIQLCSITATAKVTRFDVVIEGRVPSVGGRSIGVAGLNEGWEARTVTGQNVASHWRIVGESERPTFVVVDDQVLPLEVVTIPADKWTEWEPPSFSTKAGHDWAVRRVNNRDDPLVPLKAVDSNFRLRFKRMSFDDYLANMPKHNGPTTAWSTEDIPLCQ